MSLWPRLRESGGEHQRSRPNNQEGSLFKRGGGVDFDFPIGRRFGSAIVCARCDLYAYSAPIFCDFLCDLPLQYTTTPLALSSSPG